MQQWDQTTPIVGTDYCTIMGLRITLRQTRSKFIVERNCWATMLWAHIEAKMAEDATMTFVKE
jgi:hypothetical protein